jgi:Flp pilus assembly protein TadD
MSMRHAASVRHLAATFLLILLAACARPQAPAGPDHVAILRFENTGSDLSTDWQGRALTEILTQEVDGIPSVRLRSFNRTLGPRPISAPGISTEFTEALAAGATRVAYGEFAERNGRLETRITVEDLRTSKMVKVAEASVPAGDVYGAATALARQLSAHPASYPTHNAGALMHYCKALEAADSATADRELEQAFAADPDFPAPYTPLAQTRLQRQDRVGAEAILQKGIANTAIPALDRARFEVELAQLRGDAPARIAALGRLAKLEPNDAPVWHTLGDLAYVRHDYAQAKQAFEKAVAITPDDADLYNSLGYAAVQAGDLNAAVAALKRYRSLRPKEANPIDSLGDIYLVAGKFAEAESSYLETVKAFPGFLGDIDLMKAAMARLMTGDVAAADKVAGQYFAARQQAKDPLVDYRRAQWDWVAGRRRQAARAMEAFARASEANPGLRDAASHAWSDLTVWRLMLGDRDGATQAVQKAISLATQNSAGNAVVSRFLTLPDASPAEWGSRANQQFGAQTAIKNVALVYALLLNRQYLAAQAILEPVWTNGAALADEGLPVLLAWCYIETGRPKDAEPLLRPYPIPPVNGLSAYTGMYFPRFFYLRARIESQPQAQDDSRKFQTLSGSDPLIWGEEKKAASSPRDR